MAGTLELVHAPLRRELDERTLDDVGTSEERGAFGPARRLPLCQLLRREALLRFLGRLQQPGRLRIAQALLPGRSDEGEALLHQLDERGLELGMAFAEALRESSV